MSDADIRMRISRVEGAQLLQLVDDFRDLVTARDAGDPAVARLTPSPYPEDDDASASFADATRRDLLDRRIADAFVVRAGLAELAADIPLLTQKEALTEHELTISIEDVDAWIRTLAALRLVIASRLDILDVDLEVDVEDDPRYGVYEWLGYRLEVVVQAADSLL
ncbi:DUF2017 family protein [Microbacterium sp. 3J1]|uniref:DUF2017 family protein n=1 Tax=Microbacterium sp. 3J1 TaxID=861269 RepID=UPI000A45B7E9|nr:DUF2017 family protein [Microbacterium sp. 3J1]